MCFLLELIKGKKIRDILLDKQNWWNFFTQYADLIRIDIVTNILKVLTCGTHFIGYQLFVCDTCMHMKAVFHSCKSRFCSSCGKKATDNWISKQLQILPQTPWQHITFTFPKELQPLFWLNRNLFNMLMPIPAQLITKHAKRMGIIPGIFVAMHTFGRDLKQNLHFHLSTTLAGLSCDKTKWMKRFRFHRQSLRLIKQEWATCVINILRTQYQEGQLKLPKTMAAETFLAFLDRQTSWVVHFSTPSDNHHRNVTYLGRYLMRPPIGETRINAYDGHQVTFEYFDHHHKTRASLTVPVFDFIKRLIRHIPDRYFRVVRYYNWLSNRTRGQYLPFVYNALKQIAKKAVKLSWRILLMKTFGSDPLQCPHCQNIMRLTHHVFAYPIKTLKTKHQLISNPASYQTT